MKLPSLQTLITGIKNVLLRFPFEIISAIIGTLAALYLIDLTESRDKHFSIMMRTMLTSNLALLLFLSGTFIHESLHINKWLARTAALLLTILLFFSIHPERGSLYFLFFFLMSATLHLLVSFVPYLKAKSTHAFWQFNKNLFLRFLTSVLYSGVIYLGLALALLAVNELFEVKIEEKLYIRLWIVVAGIFNTVFFLAGIPKDLSALGKEESYPKGLKTFTQYVLLPLVTIYLVILLLYELKIIALWNLPKGWVSNLIIAYGIFGMLSILLVYPVRNDEQNKWIRIFSKSFYYLLIPLVVLMYVAILKRIGDYGFTESRYLVLAVGIWLTFIAVYFIFSRKQNIKIIPVSLFIVTLLAAVGPQSAFNISKCSQRSIIRNIFEKNNSLSDGKVKPLAKNDTLLDAEDTKKVSRALEYLITSHGIHSLKPLFNNDFDTLIERANKDLSDSTDIYNRWEHNWEIKARVMDYLNLWYNDDYPYRDYNYFYFTNKDNAFDISGYDIACSSEYYYLESSFQYGTDSITVKRKPDDNENLTVKINDDNLFLNIKPMLDNLYKKKEGRSANENNYVMAPEMMEVFAENKKYKVKIIFQNVSVNQNQDKVDQADYSKFLLLIKKL